MRIGTTELIVILIIALLIFGPQKLPEMAKTLGRTLGGFKNELSNYEDDITEVQDALKMDGSSSKKKKKKSSTKKKKKTEPKPEEDEDEEDEESEESAEAEEKDGDASEEEA